MIICLPLFLCGLTSASGQSVVWACLIGQLEAVEVCELGRRHQENGLPVYMPWRPGPVCNLRFSFSHTDVLEA